MSKNYYPKKSVLFTTMAELEEILELKFNRGLNYVIISIPVPPDKRAAYLKDQNGQDKQCAFLVNEKDEVLLELTDGLVLVVDPDAPDSAVIWSADMDTFMSVHSDQLDQDNVYVGYKISFDLNQYVAEGQTFEQLSNFISDGCKERQAYIDLEDTKPVNNLPC